MKFTKIVTVVAFLVVLGMPWGLIAPQPAVAQTEYVCLPTCGEEDAHMFSLVGTERASLAGDTIAIGFASPSTATTLEIGIFDGDSGGMWDWGATPVEYTLYADPHNDGSGTVQIGQWDGSSMPDNAWYTINIPNTPAARAPSGHYFYYMLIRLSDPFAADVQSDFKLRTNGTIVLKKQQSFGYVAPLFTTEDGLTIYPDWPNLTPTTYDGNWDLYFLVTSSSSFLEVWDGDMDFGSYDQVDNDTDDADTPNNTIPPWAVGTDAVLEGVAVGYHGATGNPPDNVELLTFRREPSVIYELVDPNGNTYQNSNPSGNSEWERFRVDTAPFDRDQMDYHADAIPPGLWTAHMSGMDLGNLNAWRFDYDVLGVCESGAPCKPSLHPYLIGDTVWYDADGDGVQDAGEAGIPGVIVQRVDAYGYVLETTTTDADGHYTFEVDAGTHTVRVAPENFTTRLAGLTSTTGDQRTNAIDQNYDFGYTGNASLGDYVWFDANGNAAQDDGPDAGIGGVTLDLWWDSDRDGTVDLQLGSTTTGVDGSYLFDHLPPGNFEVRLDPNTLPDGLIATYDLDGIATPHVAALSLTSGEHNPDVDFGYTRLGSLGDTVWLDGDSDGVQDSGEPGLPDVTVNLYDGSGTLLDTTTTDDAGRYLFEDLAAGDYQVRVDPASLPSGLKQTYDYDDGTGPFGTPHAAAVTLAHGENNLALDFGYVSADLGSLGDYVWHDIDGDGVQDAGEPGLTNVTLELYDDGGNLLATTTTNGDGYYLFDDLAAGNYTVSVDAASLPAGMVPSYDLDGVGTPHTTAVSLAEGQDRRDVDFGYTSASIGDYVWYDADRDGIQDEDESGMSGVQVNLYDDAGNLLDTTYTDGNGFYLFSGLEAGDYRVEVTAGNFEIGGPLHGYQPTLQDQGGDDALDSDGDPTTHDTWVMGLAAGSQDTTNDFGFVLSPPRSASLGDYVWHDIDGDGVQDAGEPGLANVTLELYDDGGNLLATTTTNGDGYYLFDDLAAGNYTVSVDAASLPAGMVPSYDLDGVGTPHTTAVSLAEGQDRRDVDFGYTSASIGDYVWYDADQDGIQDGDENGMSGVQVNLYDDAGNLLAVTHTDGSGYYLFSGLSGGDYRVEIAQGNFEAGGPLHGYQATLQDQGGDDALDSDGDPTTHDTWVLGLAAGSQDTTNDFGFVLEPLNLGILGDYVWYDADQDGIQDAGEYGFENVIVNLYDGSGNLLATTQTAPSGYYAFTHLAAGDYRVEIDASNFAPGGVLERYDPSPPNAGDDALDSDGDPATHDVTVSLGETEYNPTLDFGFTDQPPTASIGDYVWEDANTDGVQNDGATGIVSVTVRLYDGGGNLLVTTTTDANGYYAFNNLAAGDYMVEFVAPAGYVFSPQDQGDDALDSDADPATGRTAVFALADGVNDTTRDAGLYRPASVGDYVWQDTNGNGLQDDGATGIVSVTVNLYRSDGSLAGSTTTAADGSYSFENLTPGDYYLEFVAPAGYAFSLQDQGGDDTLDSDADPTTGRTAVFTLDPGEHDPTWDAGLYQTASVGDYVWEDMNGDGVQNDGATGIEGVTVNLYHSGGTLAGSTTTGAGGSYGFSGLTPGDYYVEFVAPAGYAFSPQDQGSDDASDSDADPTSGQTTVFTLSAGQNDPTWDAGLYRPASLGDYVWGDVNANGIQDDGESGIPDVTVNLYRSDGSLAGSTTTADDGSYSFDNLAPGDYYVEFVAPAGYAFSPQDQGGDDTLDSDADPNSGRTAAFALNSGQNDLTWDAGLYRPASVGDFVWQDMDADGIQDDGENGILDVTVNLYYSDGSLAGSTTTADDGSYGFDNLAPGDYYLEFTAPAGYVFSPRDQGSDDALDSDADPTTGQTTVFTLGEGQSDMTWDAGFIPLGSIGDYVWHDVGHSQAHQIDGIQDADEPGLEGVIVELYDDQGNLLASATTTADGFYEFGDLVAGTYTVKIADSNFASGGVLEGWYATMQDRGGDDSRDSDGGESSHTVTVSLGVGEHNSTIDFGFYRTCISLTKTGPDSFVLSSGSSAIDPVNPLVVEPQITYHFRVENCGDLVHHGAAHVYDPLINPNGDHEIWSEVVWPGEVYEFDRTYTPNQSDCGQLVNTATAVGHPKHPDGYYVDDVADQDSWTVQVICNECVTIATQNDAYIWEKNPDYTGNSDTLYTGIVGGGRKWSLISFDLSSIPAGSTLTSASFNIYRRSGGSYADQVNIYRILAPWDESSVTWGNFGGYDGNQVWGSFSANGTGWVSADVQALVQAWLDGIYENDGLLLDILPGYDQYKTYKSSEYGNGSYAAYLEICYTGGGGNQCREEYYTVENPTENPFHGIKYEWAGDNNDGDGVKNGEYDLFRLTISQATLDALLAAGGGSVEAQAGPNVGQAWLSASGDPVSNNGFTWELADSQDNGDGTYTLKVKVTNTWDAGLSHVTLELPDGHTALQPAGGSTYTSEVCGGQMVTPTDFQEIGKSDSQP